MSCNFSIHAQDSSLSNEEVSRRHNLICDGDFSGLPVSPAIEALYLELIAHHPEIDDVPDEEFDNSDFSPWSIAMDRSPAHLLVSCVWSKAEYVEYLLRDLTQVHSLILFNPQTGIAHQPKRVQRSTSVHDEQHGKKPWWRFW